MRKLAVGVLGLAVVAVVTWWLLRGRADEDAAALSAVAGQPRFIQTEDGQRLLNAVLHAPLPEPKGSLSLRGRVVWPSGPVAGALVIATRGTGEDVLSTLECKCDNHCGQRLLQCGCGEAAGQLVKLVSAREGEAPPIARVQTNRDGEFVLEKLEEGELALWVEGGQSGVGMVQHVQPGGGDVEVVLSPGQSLRGVVKDDDGKPLEGAWVTAIHAEHSRFFDVLSGKDGRFSIGPVPLGDYTLVGSRDGLLPDRDQFVARGERARELELTLSVPRAIAGRVLLEGKPVPGARVSLDGEHRREELSAGASGQFRFDALRPGDYDLTAISKAEAGGRQVELGKDADVLSVELELGPAALIEGEVRSSRGGAVADAELRAMGGAADQRAKTDASGRFRVGPLPAGKYQVYVSAKGFARHEPAEAEVGAGQTRRVSFTLEPGARLAGVVRDESGTPLAKASVTAVLLGDEGEEQFGYTRRATANSDAEGRFEITELTAGRVRLDVTHPDYQPFRDEVKTPSSDLQVVLRTGAEVFGQVLDEKGGPQARVQVSLMPDQAGQKRMLREQPKTARTDDAGRFRLKGVAEGEYVVVAWREPERDSRMPGRGRFVHAPLRVEGREQREVTLRFPLGLELSGRVVDQSGAPIEGVRVRAEADDLPKQTDGARPSALLEKMSGGVTMTDAQGRFILQDLKPGSLELEVYKLGYDRKDACPASVEAGRTDVVCTLTRAAMVSGRVVDESGRPVPSFTVRGEGVESPEGRFELSVPREGKLSLLFVAKGKAAAERTVEVSRGKDVRLPDVVLTTGRTVEVLVRERRGGAPVMGAQVRVRVGTPESLTSDEWAGVTPEGGETDGLGKVRLENVANEPRQLSVNHDRYTPLTQLLAPGVRRVEVSLSEGARLRGVVLDVRRQPLRKAVVSVYGEKLYRRVNLDASGRFEVQGLSAGSYSIGVMPADRRAELPLESSQVTLAAEEIRDLELRERVGGTTVKLGVRDAAGKAVEFWGILLSGDVPLPEDGVDLSPALQAYQANEFASGDGRQQIFHAVPPGDYTVMVRVSATDGTRRGLRVFRERVRLEEPGEKVLSFPIPADARFVPHEAPGAFDDE